MGAKMLELIYIIFWPMSWCEHFTKSVWPSQEVIEQYVASFLVFAYLLQHRSATARSSMMKDLLDLHPLDPLAPHHNAIYRTYV